MLSNKIINSGFAGIFKLARNTLATVLAAIILLGLPTAHAEPLKLHPDNNRYFLFQGKPTVLVTSAEHYGSVINLDFDYMPYLDMLQTLGFNLTKIQIGTYVQNWNSDWDNMTPAPGRLLAPWARSSTPGHAQGGNKFDLSQWDPAYFARLKDFVSQAERRGIVVQVGLFSIYYDDWHVSPLNAANNINNVGNVASLDTHNLSNAALTAAQEAVTAKIVAELNGFDNVYYEIINEPYLGGGTAAWQARIINRIKTTEAALGKTHLIAQNIANGSATISNPPADVSVFNFHYTSTESVKWNYGLNKPIAFDETGFGGASPNPYRKEAWMFVLAGGAVYNMLDWSLTARLETGDDPAWQNSVYGGGGAAVRTQLSVLARFINSFDMTRMAPGTGFIKGGVPVEAHALSEPGKQYAVWLNGGSYAELQVDLPAGSYRAEWINTQTGRVDKTEDIAHGGGIRTLASPAFSDDIALRIRTTVAGNILPSVSIAGPANGYSTTGGSSITFTSIASDPDGSVTHVAYYAGNTKIGEATASPWTFTWSPPSGVWTITAVATDNAGGTASSSAITVTVGSSGTAFYRGINLNGPALLIDGNAWDGATSANYQYTGQVVENQAQVLSPVTDSAKAQMLRAAIWSSEGTNVTLTNLPAGSYQVYLYVWENDAPITFDVLVNGTTVQRSINSGGAGQWQRLGPWTVQATSGTIAVRSNTPGVAFSGIELWRVGSDTAPVAPSGLGASADSSSQISLNWSDSSANETGFKVERRTGADGGWTQVALLAANTTFYRDTGLAASTTYSYRIRATGAGGDSAYSNEVTISTAGGTTVTPTGGPSWMGSRLGSLICAAMPSICQ